MRSRALPPAPTDVRLEMADGSIRPVEVVYVGRRWRTRHWEVAVIASTEEVRTLRIGILPPRTAVSLRVIMPDWYAE